MPRPEHRPPLERPRHIEAPRKRAEPARRRIPFAPVSRACARDTAATLGSTAGGPRMPTLAAHLAELPDSRAGLLRSPRWWPAAACFRPPAAAEDTPGCSGGPRAFGQPSAPPARPLDGWVADSRAAPAIGNRDRRHAGHRGGFRSIGTSSLSAAPSSGSPGSSKVGVEGPRPRCRGPGRSCRSRGGLGRRTRRRRDRKPPDVPCACGGPARRAAWTLRKRPRQATLPGSPWSRSPDVAIRAEARRGVTSSRPRSAAAAWATSTTATGDCLARAGTPSTPSRPRACRTPCSQGITRDPVHGSPHRKTGRGRKTPRGPSGRRSVRSTRKPSRAHGLSPPRRLGLVADLSTSTPGEALTT